MTAAILVVEDDGMIGGVLDLSLRSQGYAVTRAVDGEAALTAAEKLRFDLVLLDLGLPDIDGFEVCRRLRVRLPDTVLVVLTARTAEMDVVVGLEAGADDYLTKPVRLGELLARVRAHLRRAGGAAQAQLQVGDLIVDLESRRVTAAGRELPLRAKEFDLLARLAREPGIALSRVRLMSDVWDQHWNGSTRTLDVHIASLRRWLGDGGGRVPRIATLRGHGFRLELPEAAPADRTDCD